MSHPECAPAVSVVSGSDCPFSLPQSPTAGPSALLWLRPAERARLCRKPLCIARRKAVRRWPAHTAVASKAWGFADFEGKSKGWFVESRSCTCCWVPAADYKVGHHPSVEPARPRRAEIPKPDPLRWSCHFLPLKWSRSLQCKVGPCGLSWGISQASVFISEQVTGTRNSGNSRDMRWLSVTVVSKSVTVFWRKHCH